MQPVESSSHLLLLYMYTCTCRGTSVNSNICNYRNISSPLSSPFSLSLFPSPHPQFPSLPFSVSLFPSPHPRPPSLPFSISLFPSPPLLTLNLPGPSVSLNLPLCLPRFLSLSSHSCRHHHHSELLTILSHSGKSLNQKASCQESRVVAM